MIPIKDINPTKTFPYLTIIFIILNVYIFFLQSSLPDIAEQFFYFNHGVIPKCFAASLDPEKYDRTIEETKATLKRSIARDVIIQRRMRIIRRSELEQIDAIVEKNFRRKIFGIGGLFAEIASLFSSMFIHGSLWHLIGNMWFLWIFGNNIEDNLGVIKFIIFYLVCGIFASLGHIAVSINSVIPTIGASGAISGVLGAYLLLYPRARILTFIPIGYFFWLEDLPAYVFLGYWIIIQIIFGFLSDPILGGGVAWFAHIAGFFAGLLIVLILGKRKTSFHEPENEIENS